MKGCFKKVPHAISRGTFSGVDSQGECLKYISATPKYITQKKNIMDI